MIIEVLVCMHHFCPASLFNHQKIMTAKGKKGGHQFLSLLGIGLPIYWHKVPLLEDRDEEGFDHRASILLIRRD